jgi:hypothetical protein
MDIHLENTFECEVCHKILARQDYLTIHMRIHNNIKNYSCTMCDMNFVDATSLNKHMKIHLNILDCICTYEGCGAKFYKSDQLVNHIRRYHTLERPYKCDIEDCDNSYVCSSDLNNHINTVHIQNPEFLQRQKIQENEVKTLLKTHFDIDDQTVLHYRNGCVQNPDGYRAFIDFHVVNIINAFVIVECDERQHESYLTRCECVRMLQIHENLLTQDIQVPIVFIRYSPNGRVIVKNDNNETKVKFTKNERGNTLINYLIKIRDSIIQFENTINIIYMFYDSTNGIANICLDPEYLNELKNCTSIIYK